MKSRLLTLLAIPALALSASAEAPPAGAAEKIAAALPAEAYAKPKKPRKLLIFSVTNGYHHPSIPTGQLAFTELGKKTGAFETVVSNDLDNFEIDKLKAFDAVCFLSTTLEVFLPHPNELKKFTPDQLAAAKKREARLQMNLMDFIKAGRGFVGVHAASDTFYSWPEYGEMVGGWFDGHPWTADVQVSIKVEPGMEKHPLAAMFDGKNIDIKEEIYQFKSPYDSKKVDMFMRLDTEKSPMNRPGIKRTDKDFGVSWARHWGKGRVFYTSLGHNHEIYWTPEILKHYLAGMQWAIGDLNAEVKN